MLNSPSHDAKSGCKGTNKNEKWKMKNEKFTSKPTYFFFFLRNQGIIRIFARDKSIKLAIQEKYDKS